MFCSESSITRSKGNGLDVPVSGRAGPVHVAVEQGQISVDSFFQANLAVTSEPVETRDVVQGDLGRVATMDLLAQVYSKKELVAGEPKILLRWITEETSTTASARD